METFDKVTKGLECCGESQDCTQDNMPKCQYYEKETCLIELVNDALALIQQLEATVSEKEKVVAELSGKIGWLEAKRKQLLEIIELLDATSEE